MKRKMLSTLLITSLQCFWLYGIGMGGTRPYGVSSVVSPDSTGYPAPSVPHRLWTPNRVPVNAKGLSFTAESPRRVTYDGLERGVVVVDTLSRIGLGRITPYYYLSDAATPIVGLPCDAGRYAVKVDVAEGTNYLGASGILVDTLEIGKSPVDAAWFSIGSEGSLPAELSVLPSLKGLGSLTLRYNGESSLPSRSGVYAITLDVAEGTNYLAAAGLPLGDYRYTRHVDVVLLGQEGALIEPAGNHRVIEGSSFSFTVTPPVGETRTPVVTTNHSGDGSNGTQVIRSGDAYAVTVSDIRDYTVIVVGFTASSTAIAPSTRVWVESGNIHIYTPHASDLRIYTVGGGVVNTGAIGSGESVIERLPLGFYAVSVDGRVHKVTVK